MSSNNLNNLKKQYEEQEITPSADLWSRLEAKLDEPKAEIPAAKPSFGWWKYAAAVLILISMGYLIISQFGADQPVDPVAEVSHNEKTKSESSVQNKQILTEPEMQENIAVQSVETQKFSETVTVKKPSVTVQNIAGTKEVQKPKAAIKTFEVSTTGVKNPEIITPQIEKQELIVASEPEKKEVTPSTYIKADELLFSREIEGKRKNAKKQSSHLVDFDLRKMKRRKPSSIKILGLELIQDHQEIH